MNIKNFEILTKTPSVFTLCEFGVELSDLPKELNPYILDDIDITATFESEDGKIETKAFYFEEYDFAEDLALLGKSGKEPCFKFRITPNSVGAWNYTIKLTVKGEEKENLTGSFEVVKGNATSKILKIEPKRRQTFATPDDTPVFLIGENLFWTQPETDINLYAQYMINYMKTLAENGVNHIRIVDNIESGVSVREKLHYMRQDSSAMFDKILTAADELGIYVTFAMLHTSDTNGYAAPNKIWNTQNGGYIDDPKEFFTDERTKKAVKDYFGYVISRWGYAENIASFEMMNEIDRNELAYVWGGNFEKQKNWLKEMHDFVHNNDSYNHLVSASVFFINLWPHLIENFDFANLHQQDPRSVGMWLTLQADCNRAYDMPVLITDAGLRGDTGKVVGGILTEDLLIFHQGNWTGLMGGGAGTCMNQAWKELREFGGEKYFKPLAYMAKLIPWNNKEMKKVSVESAKISSRRIDVMGYNAKNNYYLWLYDNRYYSTCLYESIEFSNETITLKVDNGKYAVNFIDILTGETVKSEELTASEEKVTVSMPTWSKYIALTVIAL